MLRLARQKKLYLKEFCCYLDDKRLPIDDGRYHFEVVVVVVVVAVVRVVVVVRV